MSLGGEKAGSLIGSVLLNMAVFGAMFSYILQAVSFILLRQNQPNIERPYVSPLGIPGAVVTIVIGVVTLFYQIRDPNFFKGVIWVIVWFVVAIIYFALVGRHKLILSPGGRVRDGAPRQAKELSSRRFAGAAAPFANRSRSSMKVGDYRT